MIDINKVRGGHTWVKVTATDEQGFVVSTGFDGAKIHLDSGRVRDFKPAELTVIPEPPREGLPREEIHVLYADLSRAGSPHPDVVQAAVDAEVKRQRDNPDPVPKSELGTRVRLKPGTGHTFQEGVISEVEENRVRVQHGLLDGWVDRADLLQV